MSALLDLKKENRVFIGISNPFLYGIEEYFRFLYPAIIHTYRPYLSIKVSSIILFQSFRIQTYLYTQPTSLYGLKSKYYRKKWGKKRTYRKNSFTFDMFTILTYYHKMIFFYRFFFLVLQAYCLDHKWS